MLIGLIYLFLLPIELALSNEDFSLIVRDDLTVSKVKQSRNRANVPQSLTLLMNFKDDGTTSFQIMQGWLLINRNRLIISIPQVHRSFIWIMDFANTGNCSIRRQVIVEIFIVKN